MKKLLMTLMAVFATTSVFAAENKDNKGDDSKKVHVTVETIDRTFHIIEYDEKAGKAKVIKTVKRKPIADVSPDETWKGDEKKAQEAVLAALEEDHKAKKSDDGAATLGGFDDFAKGFKKGFGLIWGRDGIAGMIVDTFTPVAEPVAKGVTEGAISAGV